MPFKMRYVVLSSAFAVVIGFVLLKEAVSYPLHASCKINWVWPNQQCADVKAAIVTQIGNWANTNCETGQKCRYEVTSQTANQLKATHTTPVKHYVDDLTFNFTQSNQDCKVAAFSTSETWYAYLDYSTNYCNLRNLIDGAKLNGKPGFSEETSDSVCTQFSSKNCEKY